MWQQIMEITSYVNILSPEIRLSNISPFKLEFTIAIFIHYKPRIAVAILDLYDL